MSLQDIERLISAQIADDVISRQIADSRLDFSVSVDVLVELKNHGATAVVLSAIQARDKRTEPATAATEEACIRQRRLMAEGNVVQAIADLEVEVGRSGSGSMCRFLLTIAYVGQGAYDLASRQITELRAADDPSAHLMAEKADQFLATTKKRNAGLLAVVKKLESYDLQGAQAELEGMQLSATARVLSVANVSLLRGDWGAATSAAESLQSLGTRQRLLETIAEWRRASQEVNKKLDTYFLDASVEWDVPRGIEGTDLDVNFEDIGRSIESAIALTPYSEQTLYRAAHWIMMTADYPAYKLAVDRAVTLTGRLLVASYSFDRRFDLVVDARAKELYLENVRTDVNMVESNSTNGRYSKTMSVLGRRPKALTLSRLPFGEVKEISQSADQTTMFAQFVESGAYYLGINKKYYVPEWMFMRWVHGAANGQTQRRATYNLGRAIGELIGLTTDQMHLVDPAKKDGIDLTPALDAVGNAMFAQPSAFSRALIGVANFDAAQGAAKLTEAASIVTEVKQMMIRKDKASDAARVSGISLLLGEISAVVHRDDLQQLLTADATK
jgi:hypothetical protein